MQKKVALIVVFLLFCSYSIYGQTPNVKSLTIENASLQIKQIETENLWVDNFSPEKLTSLPIGIKSRKDGDNATYSIGIIKAEFFPKYTQLQVFAKVDIPQKGEDGQPISLFFGADDVKLSHSGGIIGDAKLSLLGDISIPINKDAWQLTLYGNLNKKTGQNEELTYAVIDCDGFKEFHLSGAVEFSRELILPLENGKVNENQITKQITLSNGRTINAPNKVRGDFNFMASSWNDLLVNVSLTPFVLAKKQNGQNYDGNFQFLVSQAVLDISDLRNDISVKFPSNYEKNGLLFPSSENWKGVFIQHFLVGLPSEFKTITSEKNQKRIEFEAENLLIDQFGVSGNFIGKNIFSLQEGITNKENAWAYSLEYIEVQIETNEFVKANFSGELLLPVTNPKYKTQDKIGLAYKGLISEEIYRLNVITTDKIAFDLWQAKASLKENSSVEFKVEEGHFSPKAILHGTIDFATSKTAYTSSENTSLENDKKTLNFKGISFENLVLKTTAPMISVGNMEYKGDVSFGGFPVSIKGIEVKTSDTNADLYFDLALNLMDKSELSARAKVGILGGLQSQNHTISYQFKGLDLSSIALKGKLAGFSLNGQLNLLDNDPIYGNGFNGDLNVNIISVGEIKAKAIFGKKDFRYWYFDASGRLSSSTFVNGFGGGAYYNMKRIALGTPSEFSPSGLTYEPYENAGLGLKAMVSFAIGSDKAFNGEAAFELLFNKNGGLDTAAIYGKGNVLTNIPGVENIQNTLTKVRDGLVAKSSFLGIETNTDKRSSFEKRFLPLAEISLPNDINSNAAIHFTSAIQLDLVNKTTHGTLDVFINAGFISGTGAQGRVGWAVFHKDPQDWYLYIGTPNDRLGIKMGVAGAFLTTYSYIMAGTKLPASPPPPSHIASILDRDAEELNYMRDENVLANGGGFAFGSNLSVDTGDLTFLIFYANFKAGLGYDVMLKDYGTAYCNNTGGQVGINGWYANGQAYAYLQGELGVRVKLLFVKMKVPIISGGAAVLVQAKLPNPVWFRGYIDGKMDILGGLIKGKFNFKLTIGEQCEFAQEGVLQGMKLITDISPKNDSKDVDVFAVPQATFSLKVNEPIEIPDDNGKTTYKVILQNFKIIDKQGVEVKGKIQFSNIKDRANFIPDDILPPNKEFKVQVEVSFQKLENGIFKDIIQNGQVAKEYEERSFVTGSAPNYIPLHNIEYSYPVVNQKFFLKDEFDKGYIKLKRGQDYLFEDSQWKTQVKIINNIGNDNYISDFLYDNSSNEISYQMPKIKNETSYKMLIFSKSLNKNPQQVAENKNIKNKQEGNDFEIEQKQAENISKNGEITRLDYEFKTSKYNTFKAKISAIDVYFYNYIIHAPDVISLANNLKESEPFDLTELVGTDFSNKKPLIEVQADLKDDYFQKYINPMLYSQNPLYGKYKITKRDTNTFGVIPSKAISINNYYLTRVQNDIFGKGVDDYFPYEYDLSIVYKEDFVDILNQIANDISNQKITQDHPSFKFLNNIFPSIRKGKYNIIMKYNIPGNKKTSQTSQRFENVIND